MIKHENIYKKIISRINRTNNGLTKQEFKLMEFWRFVKVWRILLEMYHKNKLNDLIYFWGKQNYNSIGFRLLKVLNTWTNFYSFWMDINGMDYVLVTIIIIIVQIYYLRVIWWIFFFKLFNTNICQHLCFGFSLVVH